MGSGDACEWVWALVDLARVYSTRSSSMTTGKCKDERRERFVRAGAAPTLRIVFWNTASTAAIVVLKQDNVDGLG